MQGPVHTRRLLIFDFDGTLADSGPWVAGVLNEMAARHGFRPSSGAEMEALRGQDARGVFRELGIARWRLPLIARDIRARMAREIGAIRLFDGVPGMLERLSAGGMVLAVASSNSEANVRRVLGPCAGGVAHFECGSSLFGKAARFRRVLARAGVAAGEALCIGDEMRDAEAARQAGIAFGAVGWGYNTAAALRATGPAMFFDSPGELANRLAPPRATAE